MNYHIKKIQTKNIQCERFYDDRKRFRFLKSADINIKNVISELEPLLKWILHEHDNDLKTDNPKLLRHVN